MGAQREGGHTEGLPEVQVAVLGSTEDKAFP